ncbi:hypothetical protein DL771_012273 [Monosporascus sp. 5C6A]|nr:hypothetical protein DL771_012273 [Monosporascus sp. 5C6A]
MKKTREFESFRRFRELNVKNLLYYQAQIAMLEEKLRDMEKKDYEGEKPRRKYARSAEEMFEYYEESGGLDSQQCKLVLEIRGLLNQYNAALLQHAEVSRLPQPDLKDVVAFRQKLTYRTLRVTGSGAKAWNISEPEPRKEDRLIQWILSPFKKLFSWHERSLETDLDLVTVHQAPELDRFTRWIAQDLTPIWHKICHPKTVNRTDDPNYANPTEYSEKSMLRFTSCVATVIACLLPVAGICILTTAETTGQRLGYIAGFTALFALTLMWLTDAKSRVHIFTATSAFSAVLVVFVQNQ